MMKSDRWRAGLLATVLGTFGMVACEANSGQGDATGGTAGGENAADGGQNSASGGSSGDPGGLGGGGVGGDAACIPRRYDVMSLCESAAFSGGFVDSTIPSDPFSDPKYECTANRPEVSFADGKTALFIYGEGCGRAEWRLDGPTPPGFSLVWDLDSDELLGCSYEEDVPLVDQCGGFERRAGSTFDCAEAEEYFCLLRDGGMGGARGT